MPDFDIDLPDGQRFTITAPDQQTAYDSLMQHLGDAAPQKPKDRTFAETMYENLIGSGEIDTTGERIGSLIKGGGAALARGASEVIGLPSTIMGGMDTLAAKFGLLNENYKERDKWGFREGLKNLTSPETMRGAVTGLTGADLEYKDPTTAGKYVSTVGEFVGGGGAKVPNIAAGLLSEGAGQALEGTSLETAARIIGGITGGMGAGLLKGAPKMDNVDLDALFDTKQLRYKEVEDLKIKVAPSFVDDLIVRAKAATSEADYDPKLHKSTKSGFRDLDARVGKEQSITQLDRLRQNLYTKYNEKREYTLKLVIDELDDTIDAAMAGNPALKEARLAHTRLKKAELLDMAFDRSKLSAASAGSGGNIENKMRQAVNVILKGRDAKWFQPEEIDVMRQFVLGDFDQNALRLIGKLSPNGNGLMAALNIGAVVANPYMLGVTAAGGLAKAVSDSRTATNAQNLINMAGTGVLPSKPIQLAETARRLSGGLLSQFPQ